VPCQQPSSAPWGFKSDARSYSPITIASNPQSGSASTASSVSEVRTIAADDLWLSPSYLRDSVAFHFTWISDWPAVAPVLAQVEDRLGPLQARPHWGKLFGAGPEILGGQYPRLDDFRQLTRCYDPAGKFRNRLLDRYLSPAR
jgi:alditol oxidase